MEQLLKMLQGALGGKLDAAALLKLALTLAPIAKDLTDGNARLSGENLLKVQDAIDEFTGGVK